MRWISGANQIPPPKLNLLNINTICRSLHVSCLEKAKCYKMSLENQQILKILLFMISPNFVRKSTQKKEIQQNEEKKQNLDILKKRRMS